MSRITVLSFLFSLLLMACTPDNSEKIEKEVETINSSTFTIGVVPQFSSKRIYTIWEPILKELENKTGYTFKIKGSPSIPAFEKEYQKGTFDIAYMNPFHSVVANKAQGYQAVLRDGSRALFGVLAVKKDNPIEDIKALDGKTLSFPAPNALGASLLMRTELKMLHNIDIEAKYVKTHTATYMNVLRGETTAGGGVMRTFNELSDDVKSKLRIFYKTQKTPPHPIVMHPRIPEEVKAKIVKAFLEMGENEETRELLSKIPIKEIIETSNEAYKFLDEMGMDDFYVEPK